MSFAKHTTFVRLEPDTALQKEPGETPLAAQSYWVAFTTAGVQLHCINGKRVITVDANAYKFAKPSNNILLPAIITSFSLSLLS